MPNIIKLITPPIIQKIARLTNNPKDRLREKELNKLRLLPRYQPTTTNLLGTEIEIVDACTFLGGYHEIIEGKIYEFKASSEKPLIIDCGANIGLSVFFFKTLYPSSRIIAFEADPIIFNTLVKNVSNLGLTDVEIHNEAIWTDETYISFCREGAYSGRIPKPGDRDSMIEVKTTRLRDILNQKIDFLKLDIEGAETEVIRDCEDRLTNVEHIFLEYHSHMQEKQTLHEILSIMQKAGFRYHILEAFSSQHPFMKRELMLGMDLQLNIFGYRV